MNTLKERILTIIEKNSRINLKELAIMLGTEEIEVANAPQEMETDGIICGYHTMINWDNTGDEKVIALIEVKVTPQRGMGFDKIAERIYQYSEVNSLYLMSGAPMDSVLSTATHFVLKKYKDHGTVMCGKAEDERMMITP